jgi:hypothetical protein
MQPKADLQGTTVTVSLDDREAARSLIVSATNQGGFMLGLCERPEPFATYSVLLETEDGFSFGFHARVVQIFDQGESMLAAFQLDGWVPSKMDELERKLAAEVEPAGGKPQAEASQVEGEAHGTAPIFRIKQMNPSEKMRLAMKADRAERRILCRDNSPQVLLGLLSNPRIESTDVLSIVKSTHASSGVLQRVAKDRRWMSNTEIQTALVRNPKTPTPIAIQLLESVPTRELKSMAKMGALRENVRRAAFRVYTKRTSRRR